MKYALLHTDIPDEVILPDTVLRMVEGAILFCSQLPSSNDIDDSPHTHRMVSCFARWLDASTLPRLRGLPLSPPDDFEYSAINCAAWSRRTLFDVGLRLNGGLHPIAHREVLSGVSLFLAFGVRAVQGWTVPPTRKPIDFGKCTDVLDEWVEQLPDGPMRRRLLVS
ncbi:MAG: hypothetical protein JNK05_02200 [Myxococcales bacterium]|nr:hypothetical protein [Myxococcales bacterium]